MPMPVKPVYVNPLTMIKPQKTGFKPTGNTQQENKENHNVKDLEAKQQGLKNQILLMKNNTSVGSAGTKELEQKLEEISTELKAAKSQNIQMADTQPTNKRFDTYETAKEKEESYGLYKIQQDKDKRKVLFFPYSD